MAGASDNGGRPPGGESPDELPDLPEEWGVIVIPDDLSELADEVEAVRAELHPGPPPGRLARLRRFGSLLVRTPALIVTVAVLVTVASLFASAWPGPARQPAAQRTSATTDNRTGPLPALDLVGTDGHMVAIRGDLPAVILLTDGCDCTALLTDTLAAVGSDVKVLAVTSARPSADPPATTVLSPSRTPPADGRIVTLLQDPTDTLRNHLGLDRPDGTAAVILVNHLGDIVRVHRRAASIEMIRPDVARL